MFEKGFLSKIFSELDVTSKKSEKDIDSQDIENQDITKKSTNPNVKKKSKELIAEVNKDDIEKLDAEKAVNGLKVKVKEPTIKEVKKTSDIDNVYLDISKNNGSISKAVKKSIKELRSGENKRVKTASDILEQSKETNTYLKKISDDLIDEQDTKVKRTSDIAKETEKVSEKDVVQDSPKNSGWIGAVLGMASAFLTSMASKLIKKAMSGVWKYIKSAVSSVWKYVANTKIGTWIGQKAGAVGTWIGQKAGAVKSALGFGAKETSQAGNLAKGAESVAKGANIAEGAGKITTTSKIGEKIGYGAAKAVKGAKNFTGSMIKKAVGKIADNAVIKKVIESVMKRKMASVAASKIPVFGLAVGAFTSAMYAMDGDWTGASAALGSAALGATGAGAPAALAIDILLLAREVYRMVYDVLPEKDKYFKARFDDIKNKISAYITSYFAGSSKDKDSKAAKNTASKAKANYNKIKTQAKTQQTKVPTSNVNKSEKPKSSLFDNFKSGLLTSASFLIPGGALLTSGGAAIDDIQAGAGNAVQWAKNLLVSKNDVKVALRNASMKTGVPEDFLAKIANIESGFDPSASAKTSSAGGLFQFLDSTWAAMLKSHGREYGLSPTANKFDANASALMGAAYIKDNMKALKGVKSNLTATDLYMAHFMGSGGAKNFLAAMAQNPDGNGAALFPKAANANKGVFFTKSGQPRTLASIYKMFQNKLGDNGTSQDLMSGVNTASPKGLLGNAISSMTGGAGGYGMGSYGAQRGGGGTQASTFGGGGDTSGYMQTKTVEGVTAKFTAPVGGKMGAALSVGSGVDMSGIQPTFLGNLSAMAADFKQRTGQQLQINSGFRSFEKQQQLYNEGVAKYGADKVSKWVAKPGGSMHNFGLAVDISSKQGNILNDSGLLHAYGFVRPLPNEPWHVEPDAINRAAVKANPSGESAKIKPVTVPKGPVQDNIKASQKPSPGADKQKAQTEKAMLPEGPKKASQNTIKYPETGASKNALKPTADKSDKEQKVATNSKSLADGTKSRETGTEVAGKENSTVVNINSNKSKGDHVNNKEVFRKDINKKGK